MTLRTLLATVLVASAASFASADFDSDVANIALLQSKPIQTELKVSAAQRATLNKHADWFNAENKKLSAEAEALAKQGKQPTQALINKGTKLGDTMKTKVLAVLSKYQKQRLREITLQGAGYLALMDPIVGKRVGVTADQTSKIRKQFEASGKKAGEIQQKAIKPIMDKYKDKKPKNAEEQQKLATQFQGEMGAAQKKVEPQLKKLQDEFNAFVKKTLTAAQMKTWNGLLGAKYVGK